MNFGVNVGPWELANDESFFPFVVSDQPPRIKERTRNLYCLETEWTGFNGKVSRDMVTGQMCYYGIFSYLKDGRLWDESPVTGWGQAFEDGSSYKITKLKYTEAYIFGTGFHESYTSRPVYGGNDNIYGTKFHDNISTGNGKDKVWGGKGEDYFWISNKTERGRKHFDIIKDFEVGVDWVGVNGSAKGMYLKNKNGDAYIMKGKHPLAILEDAGGSVEWLEEGGTWWVG